MPATIEAPVQRPTDLDGIDVIGEDDEPCHILYWGGHRAACGATGESCDYASEAPERLDACPGCGRLVCVDCKVEITRLVRIIEGTT